MVVVWVRRRDAAVLALVVRGREGLSLLAAHKDAIVAELRLA